MFYNEGMDVTKAQKLNELNKAFYKRYASSFSKTRSSAWQGWDRLARYVLGADSILDVACGNMRFWDYAVSVKESRTFEYYGVDDCVTLVPESARVMLQQLDIVECCIGQKSLADSIMAPPCDLVVAFGLLHHVPGIDARIKLMNALVSKTNQGGIITVSFWHFMDDARIARNARRATEEAQGLRALRFDDNDYFLGWQGDTSTLRYCHHFERREIESLVNAVRERAELVEAFQADGRMVPLNTYIVLRRLS